MNNQDRPGATAEPGRQGLRVDWGVRSPAPIPGRTDAESAAFAPVRAIRGWVRDTPGAPLAVDPEGAPTLTNAASETDLDGTPAIGIRSVPAIDQGGVGTTRRSVLKAGSIPSPSLTARTGTWTVVASPAKFESRPNSPTTDCTHE